jgi:hypothetical protein
MEPVNSEQEITVKGNIIGEVRLGSDSVLYHGSAKPFTYSAEGIFDPNDTGGDGAHDYGEGLYLTFDKQAAEQYSLVRGQGFVAPYVSEFSPHNARILDVRNSMNPEQNGVLPEALVASWKDYLNSYVENDENYKNVPAFIADTWREGVKTEFLMPVTKALEEHKPLLIRDKNGGGIFGTKGVNGLVSHIFRGFLTSYDGGYDGMIYQEMAEGEKEIRHTSVVIMNPRKVDTKAGWEQRNATAA